MKITKKNCFNLLILSLLFLSFIDSVYAIKRRKRFLNVRHETGDAEIEGEEETPSCESQKIDPENYDLRLHVGSLFIILVTSSFGAFLPVVTKGNPKIKLPRTVYFICKHFGTGVILATSFIHMIPSSFENLTNECLGKVWTEYSAWAGVIAMMAALFVFFIEYLSIKSTSQVKDKELPRNNIVIKNLDNDDDDDDVEDDNFHSHGTILLLSSEQQTLGVIILEIGICIHSVIIGMALAVTVGSDFISLFIALIFHQLFEGLGLGSRIAETNFSKKSIKPWLMSLAYGTTTPIGIAIGIIAHESYDPGSATAIIVQGVLDSVSAGILLYVALVELIAHDFIFDPTFRKKKNLTQTTGFVCLISGAAAMAVIGRWA
ncbi:hypothetical protein Glove_718g9 [Diversispora epigaea]|uniref:ZIP zinc/iron transport family n=1 Tax=Diversispora epigaea TaxID=1348612 RepID=A0A397G907_9GLOM|nr:hypothetical protein Glove_718g9 [Diversispora epigaea]